MTIGGLSYTAVVQTGLESYAVNNVEDGVIVYIGKVRADGNWVVQRYDTVGGTMGYANFSNNPGVIGYGSAWTQRSTMTYSGFETLTGV